MPNNSGAPHYLPYPLLPEASDVPADIKALALQVHTRLNVSTPVGLGGSGIISGAAGWTISDRAGQLMGKVVHMQCAIRRAGASITVDSGGRIQGGTEVLVGTLSAPYTSLYSADVVGSYENLDSYALFYIRGASVYLAGVKPGSPAIANDHFFRLTAQWLVA